MAEYCSNASHSRLATVVGDSLFLLALVHRSRLDRQLAEGVDPDQGPALSLRARQLQGMRPRRSLANSLERDIEMTERYPDGAALPISRAEVTRARPLLLLLLERPREPGASALVAWSWSACC